MLLMPGGGTLTWAVVFMVCVYGVSAHQAAGHAKPVCVCVFMALAVVSALQGTRIETLLG